MCIILYQNNYDKDILDTAIKWVKADLAKVEKKGSIKKLLKIIGAINAFVAALLTILHLLGWLEPIKAFIAKILWRK